MTFQLNGANLTGINFNGVNVSEAYMNGVKIFPDGPSPMYITYYNRPGTSGDSFTASIGQPAADRLVVLTIAHVIGGSLVNVTIGGVAATILQVAGSIGWEQAAIAYALVPTGTTAPVTINWNSSQTATVGVYNVSGVQNTSHISWSRTTSPISHSFSTQPGDVLIGSANYWTSLPSYTSSPSDYRVIHSYNGATATHDKATGTSYSVTGTGSYESVAVQFR